MKSKHSKRVARKAAKRPVKKLSRRSPKLSLAQEQAAMRERRKGNHHQVVLRHMPGESLLGRFGRYIRQRREDECMSIREFAKHAQIPFSNIFQFEQLRKNPRLTELDQLARAFGESLTEFLEPVVIVEADEPRTSVSIV